MRNIVVVSALILCWLALFPDTQSVGAYSKVLTQAQVNGAIEYGKSRRGLDLVGSDSPYALDFGRRGDTSGIAIVYTPWLEVAGAAWDAATKYRDPTDDEIRDAVGRATGKVRTFAYVVDSTDGFWRNFHSVIMQGGNVIQPTDTHGTFRSVVSCRQTPCMLSATLVAVFSTQLLDATGDAELVLILGGGRKELRAIVRLAAMQ